MTKNKNGRTFLMLAVLPSLLMLSWPAIRSRTTRNPRPSSSSRTSWGRTPADRNANFLQSDVVSTRAAARSSTPTWPRRRSGPASWTPPRSSSPSGYSDIILDRYVVSYSRSDGQEPAGRRRPLLLRGRPDPGRQGRGRPPPSPSSSSARSPSWSPPSSTWPERGRRGRHRDDGHGRLLRP